MKLFDFGFAINMPSPNKEKEPGSDKDPSLLYDKCGTPRYMAAEVALALGYGYVLSPVGLLDQLMILSLSVSSHHDHSTLYNRLSADVYSFGILYWEICALKKPFGKIKTANEFHSTVIVKKTRPKVEKKWPKNISEIMETSWSDAPSDRPTMAFVKTMLYASVRDLAAKPHDVGGNSLRKSVLSKRFTWDL